MCTWNVDVLLKDSPDKQFGEAGRLNLRYQVLARADEFRPNCVAVEQSRCHEVESLRNREDIGQQVSEVVDLDPTQAKYFGKRVMFLTRTLRPHHVVKQQRVHVVRREPCELQTWPMQDDLLELAHFRINVLVHPTILTR